MKKKVKYREDYDILHLSTGEQSQESVPIGGMIVDLDHNKNPVGIEILDASETIGDMYEGDVRAFLTSIKEADIMLRRRSDMNWIFFKLYATPENKEVVESFRFGIPETGDSVEA